ncbi:vacuolar protein sorting-associated protein 52 A-like isoform X1 [Malania oleifera]|uniref:vacuolar protein sorting-associated protein 52 A-like isoform X1 n=1 Tax=Malania oleifera TaxID=397392 RepID=UPI0025AE9E80|nr:vacuolar protein sorting-associated protein 52 A-like isoform X1 [Malania oleifera]
MADAAVGKGHSYGEINSMQKNAFDLGVFVGDLSFEEDASSDDVSLEGLQEELEECKNDDEISHHPRSHPSCTKTREKENFDDSLPPYNEGTGVHL